MTGTLVSRVCLEGQTLTVGQSPSRTTAAPAPFLTFIFQRPECEVQAILPAAQNPGKRFSCLGGPVKQPMAFCGRLGRLSHHMRATSTLNTGFEAECSRCPAFSGHGKVADYNDGISILRDNRCAAQLVADQLLCYNTIVPWSWQDQHPCHLPPVRQAVNMHLQPEGGQCSSH